MVTTASARRSRCPIRHRSPCPTSGRLLPPFDTPTVDNHRGVEPYCTLTPKPCPLHDVTLTQALASGKPVAYMIGTPAHCQTGTCAPALEFLVKSHDRVGDAVVMVHADVYSDDAATTVAPAVTALGLEYEPVLYLVKDGTDRQGPDRRDLGSERARRARSTRSWLAVRSCEVRSAEAGPATAGAAGVGVVDREAGLVEAVLVVERCTLRASARRPSRRRR